MRSSLLGVACLIALLVGGFASAQNGTIQKLPGNPGQSVEQKNGTGNFQSAPVNAILDVYEQLSGKHLIRDSNLNGMPPVSVNTSGQSPDESLKLITATLLLNGIAIVPVDDQTLKVITTGTNKNPRSEGIRLYTDPKDLPADDQIVSYYMPFDHISSQEAAGIFTQVAPVHTYGGYVPSPSANGVVLTENVNVIRELIDLKKQIDVRRDVLPPLSPSPQSAGHHPPPRHHPFCFLILIVIVFLAGYFIARFQYRKSAATV